MSSKKYKFKEPNGSGAFAIQIDNPLVGFATWTIIGGTSPFVGDQERGNVVENASGLHLIGLDGQSYFTIKGAKFSDPEGKHYDAECEICENVGGPWETPPKMVGTGPGYYNDDNCFHGNTLVHMADGSLRPIREVRAGDAVQGPDGQVTVEENRKSQHENYLEVVLSNDTILHVSWGQEFRLPDGGTVLASHMHIGQYLENLDGVELRVDALRLVPAPVEMFDLQIRGASSDYAVTIQKVVTKIKP